MIYLVGGPPRVGKSTLAAIVLEEASVPYCSTDMLVGMLEVAVPSLGVRHGFHPEKAHSMVDLLTQFVRCADAGNDAYLIEGDVITPSFAVSVAPHLRAVRAIFIGNIGLTVEQLQRTPDWLEGYGPAEYEEVRREVVQRSHQLRDECLLTGQIYIEMADGWDQGLTSAANALGI